LTARLAVIQGLVREFLDEHTDCDLRVVSMCAGKGLDLIEVLAAHPAKERVSARLVELDPGLADEAREAASRTDLAGVDVVEADAAMTDAYAGGVPADLVLACGVFGNISDADVRTTVRAMPSFCAPRGSVIWTRHRGEPDLTPAIRHWFSEAGFGERALVSPGIGKYAVGVHHLEGSSSVLPLGRRLFTFLR
jgi:hypothetical protein